MSRTYFSAEVLYALRHMYYVYVLKSLKTHELYYGYTSDLKRRLTQHNNGESTFTRSARPWTLVYYEAYRSPTDARKRERMLKFYGQAVRRLKERIPCSLTEK